MIIHTNVYLVNEVIRTSREFSFITKHRGCKIKLMNSHPRQSVRGKMFLPWYGKEILPVFGKEFFPAFVREIFAAFGKEIFPAYGKEIFSSITQSQDKAETNNKRRENSSSQTMSKT